MQLNMAEFPTKSGRVHMYDTRCVQKVRGLLLSFFTWLIKMPLVDMNRKSVFISKSMIYFYC
jgi:hypothetical protein